MILPIFQPAPLKEGFSVKTTNRGRHIYEMLIQDPSHYLSCALRVKVKDYSDAKGMVGKAVVCYVPPIGDDLLKRFIDRDAMLYDMLMVQFQMRILKALLLFCADHYACQLVIYTDGRRAEKFSTYAGFLSHYAETVAVNRQKSEILVPVNPEALNKWIDFMDRANQDFRQTLQRERRFNYAIQSYLKWDPHLRFFY